jgi:signal transduction histidine kinase
MGGALIAVAGILASLALVFTNASGVTETADDARVQQRAESLLGTTAAVRTTLGSALLVAETGGAEASLALLIEDAREILAVIQARASELAALLDEDDPGFTATVTAVTGKSEALIADLEAGRTEEASRSAAALAAEYDGLIDRLVAIRDERARAIAEASSEAGRVATAARFMVAFGVPGIALLGLLAYSRRRRRQIILDAELAHEREVNRSKDQLIANISHELRTPLTGIYGAALAIEDSDFEPGLTEELNGVVIDQSTELKRMVEDLLVSAQAEVGRLSFHTEPTSIAAQVNTTVGEFQRTGKEIRVDVAPETVVADALRVRQILRNLISNARRHGGEHIDIAGRRENGVYRLTVSDDGPGVPQEIRERLFSPFVHHDDRPLITGSVGLGLSITRLLAEGMSGSIDYHRASGKTRFRLNLPMSDESPRPPEDLTLVRGIGPTYEVRLAEMSIDSLSNLIEADPDAVADRLQLPRARIEAWVAQARSLLAD